ncbi:sialic acid-binding Ig-like lectin 12 [Melanotaenia boesemani]|uniref:sialic acid-binding Ig-like lectin 12 n=1 Tax=Melanotaenia boesemani TaxID=1250792 RepID=UPI001C056AA5|nr:sialic acid-binding Ig-like lectin 12 [Melanotaenia boesemani]
MPVLFWATMFLTLTGSNADTGASTWGKQLCQHGFCITLEEVITAEAGLSFTLPCSFTVSDGFTPQSVAWYQCAPSKERCGDSDLIFHTSDIKVVKRVSMLEPDVSRMNCSIVVNDGRVSDSGSYQLRVIGLLNNRTDGFTFTPRTNVFVKDSWGKQHCQHGFCVTLQEGNVTAEAGICVVIPCSFTTSDSFTPQTVVWYKCEPSKARCGDPDIIFYTNEEKVQSGFIGRVSMLEPDVSRKNCSIMVNDLRESDSGSYQLRVIGLLNGKTEGFTFFPRINISVEDLKQKPTVMVPPLTEGRQTTLTCTAPGLCSGSLPEITWMWRGAGGKDVYIPGNVTAVHTESLTAVSQRHSSSLTFNPSAEHHNINVTCKISFTGGTTTEKTVTLQVNLDLEKHCGVVPWTVAGVSLAVNVFFIILSCCLWNTRQKVKPSQEDRTYVSLQKLNTSPEYDVIAQRQHR